MDFEEDKGTWFEIVPGCPEEGRIKLRIATIEHQRERDKKTRKKVVEYKSIVKNGPLQRFEYFEYDEELQEQLDIDFSITDWEVITVGGKPLDPTMENKFMLWSRYPEFTNAYNRGIKKLNQEFKEMYGGIDEEKNSESTQNIT